jgi:hypothetical protein
VTTLDDLEAAATAIHQKVVMKRADLIYPVQLRSATDECRGGQASVCHIGRRAAARLFPNVPLAILFRRIGWRDAWRFPVHRLRLAPGAWHEPESADGATPRLAPSGNCREFVVTVAALAEPGVKNPLVMKVSLVVFT